MARFTFFVGLGWYVRADGRDDRYDFGTQKEAHDFAINWAKQNQPSQVLLQRTDGQWENYSTYGDDPFPPSG